MKQLLMIETIAPLLRMQYCAMICLSTEMDNYNFFSQWLNSKDPKMQRIAIRIRKVFMCDACAKASATNCEHRLHMLPPHVGSNDVAQLFMKGGGNNVFAREMLGRLVSDDSCIFDTASIDRLAQRERFELSTLDTSRATIFTAIDPGGGSLADISHSAILSMIHCYRNGEMRTVIVGMAEYNVRSEIEINKMTHNYFQKLAKHSILKKIPHIVTCENNYGGYIFADTWMNRVKNSGIHFTEYRDKPEVCGTFTTHATKNSAVMQMISDMSKDRIYFANDMIVMNNLDEDAKTNMTETRLECINTFISQCANMHKVFRKSCISFSGKRPGLQDDLVSAYLIASYIACAESARALAIQSDRMRFNQMQDSHQWRQEYAHETAQMSRMHNNHHYHTMVNDYSGMQSEQMFW